MGGDGVDFLGVGWSNAEDGLGAGLDLGVACVLDEVHINANI